MRSLLILLLLAVPAHAETYLLFPNEAAALARSKAECQRRGCDGVNTVYWWAVVTHPTTKQAAIVLEDAPRSADHDFTGGAMTAAEKLRQTPKATLDAAGWFPVLSGGPAVSITPP